jgi:hypothetical protein
MAGFVFGGLLAVVAIGVGTQSNSARAERQLNQLGTEGSGLDVFHSTDGRQLTLVDRRKEVMAVYGIDPKTQEITLRSVRNFRWDLQMDVFNGMDPQPEQIRALLEKSR